MIYFENVGMELCSTERGIVKLFECLDHKKCKITKKIVWFQAIKQLAFALAHRNHYTHFWSFTTTFTATAF